MKDGEQRTSNVDPVNKHQQGTVGVETDAKKVDYAKEGNPRHGEHKGGPSEVVIFRCPRVVQLPSYQRPDFDELHRETSASR